jgi:GH24 family phage-related lysozyme (muramidase)
MTKAKVAVALLTLSAAGFAALAGREGWEPVAKPPVPGDRATFGFGSTFKEDGSAVKAGETITPQRAIRLSVAHITKDEPQLRRCVTAPVSQEEWDILVDFAYWRGVNGACRSEVVKNINAQRYAEACAAYLNLDSRKAAGRDCKAEGSGCRGVWLRAQERYRKCREAQ